MCQPISPRPTPIEINPLLDVAPVTAAPATKGRRKSVSFYEKVDVYVIDRLDPFAIRELFYRPVDFHRFRSESCLEILEAESRRGGSKDPLTATLRALLSGGFARSDQLKLRPPTEAPCNQGNKKLQLVTQKFTCGSGTRVPPQRLSPESLLRELSFTV